MSDVLKEEIFPLLRDEFLLEGFYNFSITAVVQDHSGPAVRRPATEGSSKGLFAGLQTYIKF